MHVINTIEQAPEWSNTVIIITYDDSDGWYDHVYNVINGSATAHDTFSSAGTCGDADTALPGVDPGTLHAQGRCGYGPRLPLLLISPWAKPNYVSHVVTDQSSVLRFIEDNFLHQQRIGQGSYDEFAGSFDDMLDFSGCTPKNGAVILLDDTTGQITSTTSPIPNQGLRSRVFLKENRTSPSLAGNRLNWIALDAGAIDTKQVKIKGWPKRS